MFSYRTLLSVSFVVVFTVVSGLIAGTFSNRWGQPLDLTTAGKQLEELPESFGEWQLSETHALSEEVVETLQCAGSLHQVYRNVRTGESVNVVLIAGPPGPTSVHTPEICYSSREYDIIETPYRVDPSRPGVRGEAFWSMTLRSKALSAHFLRVAYAWNDGDGWVAPEQPRFSFGHRPLLYKLQIASVVPNKSADDDADPCIRFLQAFLPSADAMLLGRKL